MTFINFSWNHRVTSKLHDYFSGRVSRFTYQLLWALGKFASDLTVCRRWFPTFFSPWPLSFRFTYVDGALKMQFQIMIQQVWRRNGNYFSPGGNFSLHPSFFHPRHPIERRVRPQSYFLFITPIALSNIFNSKFEFDKRSMNFQIIWQESLFFLID